MAAQIIEFLDWLRMESIGEEHIPSYAGFVKQIVDAAEGTEVSSIAIDEAIKRAAFAGYDEYHCRNLRLAGAVWLRWLGTQNDIPGVLTPPGEWSAEFTGSFVSGRALHKAIRPARVQPPPAFARQFRSYLEEHREVVCAHLCEVYLDDEEPTNVIWLRVVTPDPDAPQRIVVDLTVRLPRELAPGVPYLIAYSENAAVNELARMSGSSLLIQPNLPLVQATELSIGGGLRQAYQLRLVVDVAQKTVEHALAAAEANANEWIKRRGAAASELTITVYTPANAAEEAKQRLSALCQGGGRWERRLLRRLHVTLRLIDEDGREFEIA